MTETTEKLETRPAVLLIEQIGWSGTDGQNIKLRPGAEELLAVVVDWINRPYNESQDGGWPEVDEHETEELECLWWLLSARRWGPDSDLDWPIRHPEIQDRTRFERPHRLVRVRHRHHVEAIEDERGREAALDQRVMDFSGGVEHYAHELNREMSLRRHDREKKFLDALARPDRPKPKTAKRKRKKGRRKR